MKRSTSDILELFIVYIIIFLMLKEWLVPITQLTGTGYGEYILLFVGLALLLNVFYLPFWLVSIIKLLYISLFIFYTYTEKVALLSADSFHFFMEQIQVNAIALATLQLSDVTNPFRTLLLFILIWMLIYLIHQYLVTEANVFYFFMITVFFLATLDTFSEYDGGKAMVRVIILGLILMGILYVKRLGLLTGERLKLTTKLMLLTPFIIFVIVWGYFATLLPSYDSVWADPVAFVKETLGDEDNKKVGYGNNDEALGGSVADDDTKVFKALVPERQYWRMETKNIYTSKGWKDNPDQSFSTLSGGVVNTSLNQVMQPTQPQQAVIKNYEAGKALGIYAQAYVPATILANNANLQMTNTSEKITAPQTPMDEEYQILYEPIKNPIDSVRASTMADYQRNDAAVIENRTLPTTVPQRVRDLAQEITKDKDSVYDKAKAIELYFKNGEYTYDKLNVGTPAEDQDYVDQFLFETKRGYCDNFSTAMIVMLRSVDIPARWVKGFAPGTYQQKDPETGLEEYLVTNNEAHSWVEVYLPQVGWVQFEPTIGFTSLDMFAEDQPTEQEQQLEDKPEEEQTLEEEQQEQTTAAPSFFKKMSDLIYDYRLVGYILLLMAMIVAIAALFTRKLWLPGYYTRKFKRKAETDDNFMTMYEVLTQQLARYGYRRAQGETLHNFAQRVDQAYDTTAMRELTSVYEQLLYRKTHEITNFAQLKESWEYLINLTTG